MLNNTSRLMVLTIAAAVIAVSAAAPAGAADLVTNSKSVVYRDIDLSSSAGAEILKQRVVRAAKDVCWQADGPTLEEQARYDACRADAIANASSQMNAVIASARSENRYAMNDNAIGVHGR
jgi:UrcA family protein